MKVKYVSGILFGLYFPVLVHSFQNGLPVHQFSRDASQYSFRGSFFVGCDPDIVIKLIWDPDHVEEYSAGAQSVKVKNRSEIEYDLIFRYQRLLFMKNKSFWHRILKYEERKIIFDLVTNSSSLPFVPEMEYSSGYYTVTAATAGCVVECYQECAITPGILKDSYIRIAEREAQNFMIELEAFIQHACDHIDAPWNLDP